MTNKTTTPTTIDTVKDIKKSYTALVTASNRANKTVQVFCDKLNALQYDKLIFVLNGLVDSFKSDDDKAKFAKRLQNYKTDGKFIPAVHADGLVLRRNKDKVYSYGKTTGLHTTTKTGKGTGKGTQKDSELKLLNAKVDAQTIAAKAEKTKHADTIKTIKDEHVQQIKVNSVKGKTARQVFDRLQSEMTTAEFKKLAAMMQNYAIANPVTQRRKVKKAS